MVVDGSKASIGTAVFNTHASVINFSTVQLLIRFAFNNCEIFHWDIPVAFTNTKNRKRLE